MAHITRTLPALCAVLAAGFLLAPAAGAQNPIAPYPEMDVERNATSVPDGSTDDLGSQSVAFDLTYTIRNNGPGELNLVGVHPVQIIAQVSCTVSVTAFPATPVPSGGSTSFTLSCTPSAGPGSPYYFNIAIASDDPDENPYDWGVTAGMSGGPPPPPPGDLDVERASTSVADGSTDDVGVQSAAFHLTYTLENNGFSALALTGSPLVTVSCPVNCAASVTALPATPIAGSGGTTNLTVSCTPAGTPFRFHLSVPAAEGDENPYDWTVQGTTSLASEMDVDRGGTPVADGSSEDVGSQDAGVEMNLTYTITNTGTGPLLFPDSAVSSLVNCEVSVENHAQRAVAPSETTSFTLSVTPETAGGAFSFDVSISSNDADENPYDWSVNGTTPAPPPPPDDDDGGSCAPARGRGGSGNLTGLLLLGLAGLGLWLRARRRGRTRQAENASAGR